MGRGQEPAESPEAPGSLRETAVRVFDDPCALTQRDETAHEEERWMTLGAIGPGAILLVVHTWLEKNGEEVIRIISARAAGARERRSYEEAHQGAKERYRRHRGEEGRRY